MTFFKRRFNMSLEERPDDFFVDEHESSSIHGDDVVSDTESISDERDDDVVARAVEEAEEEDEEEDEDVVDDFFDIQVTRYSEPLKGSRYLKKMDDILMKDDIANMFYSEE